MSDSYYFTFLINGLPVPPLYLSRFLSVRPYSSHKLCEAECSHLNMDWIEPCQGSNVLLSLGGKQNNTEFYISAHVKNAYQFISIIQPALHFIVLLNNTHLGLQINKCVH